MEKTIHNHFSRLENDARLNVWHFTLLTAILLLGARQRQSKVINVSRSRLMAISRIQTLPTYHKYFKELQELGIIKYTPSYHPGYRSKVEILVK
jgi:uracil-DNA glycosylase